ncbi:MAG: YjfB family protein [Lachnospiraceae bacterium]|nr:YjfB family protein [Lachnospiraceae bacterium]
MDIPALSMGLAQSKVMDQVSAAVLSMALDTVEQQGSKLLELMGASTQEMELSVHPNLGANIDITL